MQPCTFVDSDVFSADAPGSIPTLLIINILDLSDATILAHPPMVLMTASPKGGKSRYAYNQRSRKHYY